jgi:lipopolysaccharide biosynthesis regulator YciM
MLPSLLECWRRLGRDSLTADLLALFDTHPSPPLMLLLCDALESERGPRAAREFLVGYLRRQADLAGAERLLRLRSDTVGSGDQEDAVLHDVIAHQRARQPLYQCDHCGFEARELHWQCPSCKRWGSIQACEPEPIQQIPALRQRKIA